MARDLKFSFVGDMSFHGDAYATVSSDVFTAVSDRLKAADFVIGNLESPLINVESTPSNKCRLHANPRWASEIRRSGIEFVSLANNHVMDFGSKGLASTFRALEAANVRYFGAGLDIEAATAPLICEIRGLTIAIFGRSDVEVSSHCFATSSTPGVARFCLARTISDVESVRDQVDLVVLSIHWGLEEYDHPSPSQREQAAALLRSGVDCLVGHHPHVLQGHDLVNKRIAAYSVGNFVFSDFDWVYKTEDGREVLQEYRMPEKNRTGAIVTLQRGQHGLWMQHYDETFIERDGKVRYSRNQVTKIPSPYRLSGAARGTYRAYWFLHALRIEWRLRIMQGEPTWRLIGRLHRLRFRHFRDLTRSIVRSAKVLTQRSRNPYE